MKKVVQLFHNTAYDFQLLSYVDEVTGNTETLTVTDGHPFYVDGEGWADSEDLLPGQHLFSSDGHTLTVISNQDQKHPEGVAVYNFEVEGDHTYFVADGQGQADAFVWVHNATSCGLHHIATNKHTTEWTPKFQRLYSGAGMKLSDRLNLIKIAGHKGPHPDLYHQAVFNRLTAAVKGLRRNTVAYRYALHAELQELRHDVADPRSILNFLITHPNPHMNG